MVERFVKNILEDTISRYNCRNYSSGSEILTLRYENIDLLILEGCQIVNEVCKKLSIEPQLIIGQNNIKYMKFLGVLFHYIRVLDVNSKKIEIRALEEPNNLEYSLATINESRGKVVFKMPGLISLAKIPEKSVEKKYYVYSDEPEMLYEKFYVANKIRKNGAIAFFDTTDRTKLEILESLVSDKNTLWLLVEINRCLIYNVNIGENQIEDSLYYKNIGKKSIEYPSNNGSDDE